MKGSRIEKTIGTKDRASSSGSGEFLKSSNMPAARFGREAVKDPRFVFDLRNGREPRPRTVERVRAFLEAFQ